MNWIDTNILISICTCAISLTQFLFWRYIAKQKSYEAEKGKNLATKEDIKDITDKVESVKASYNESLERHKIELQKEFEESKYISNMLRSLDNLLIKRISECLEAESSITDIYNRDNYLISANNNLADFLWTYKMRYKSNETIQKLSTISNKIRAEDTLAEFKKGNDENDDPVKVMGKEEKEELLSSLEAALSLFLPPFNEKPEH